MKTTLINTLYLCMFWTGITMVLLPFMGAKHPIEYIGFGILLIVFAYHHLPVQKTKDIPVKTWVSSETYK